MLPFTPASSIHLQISDSPAPHPTQGWVPEWSPVALSSPPAHVCALASQSPHV